MPQKIKRSNSRANVVKIQPTGPAVVHVLKMIHQSKGKAELYEAADEIFGGKMTPSMALALVEDRAKLVGIGDDMRYVEEN